MRTTEVAIVGAGPAGLAAAAEAVARGVRVTLFDENPLPGGQYFRQGAVPALREIAVDVLGENAKAKALLAIVEHPRVEYRPDATVVGFFDDDLLACVEGGQVQEVRPRGLIVATGATERPVPFPGWTLPGVMGAGGALNLIKGQCIVPGRRVLVTGNGPLGLLVAATLVRVGVTVVELIEAAAGSLALGSLFGLVAGPRTLVQGLGYRATLLRAGVPYRWGWVVTEARGERRVEEAVMAPIDEHGRVDHTRSRVLAVDTIVTGFGLLPATEFTRSLHCNHVYNSEAGGWVPVRSETLETTQRQVFCAGDCGGIAGAENALVEGRLAGLAAALRLGHGSETESGSLARRLSRRLRHLRRFRSGVTSVFATQAGFLSLLTEDTLVCRCEEVTAGQIDRHLRAGMLDIETLKAATRIGMGRCQGRSCLVTLAALLARHAGCDVAGVVLPKSRPPMRPVLIGSLSNQIAENQLKHHAAQSPKTAWTDE